MYLYILYTYKTYIYILKSTSSNPESTKKNIFQISERIYNSEGKQEIGLPDDFSGIGDTCNNAFTCVGTLCYTLFFDIWNDTTWSVSY